METSTLLSAQEWAEQTFGSVRLGHQDRTERAVIPSCDLSEKNERMRKQVGDTGSRRITWPGSHELLLISLQKNSKRD
jgi:hypothetical protein